MRSFFPSHVGLSGRVWSLCSGTQALPARLFLVGQDGMCVLTRRKNGGGRRQRDIYQLPLRGGSQKLPQDSFV